jgi:hypothetical protein
MHPAAKFQFERAAREYSQWCAVPEKERSSAPAWWWQPACEVSALQDEMPDYRAIAWNFLSPRHMQPAPLF